MRIIAAFAIAPLTFGVLAFLANPGAEAWWVLKFSILVAYPMTLVLGLPTYFLLKKLQLLKLRFFLLAGCVMSVVPVLYFVFWPKMKYLKQREFVDWFSTPIILQSAVIMFACLITVLSFWMIARPDKQRDNG